MDGTLVGKGNVASGGIPTNDRPQRGRGRTPTGHGPTLPGLQFYKAAPASSRDGHTHNGAALHSGGQKTQVERQTQGHTTTPTPTVMHSAILHRGRGVQTTVLCRHRAHPAARVWLGRPHGHSTKNGLAISSKPSSGHTIITVVPLHTTRPSVRFLSVMVYGSAGSGHREKGNSGPQRREGE